MGYAMCVGTCFGCGRPFTFNPIRVPSIKDQSNVKQPICLGCVNYVNPIRIANGLQPIVPHPEAYTECDERELGGD